MQCPVDGTPLDLGAGGGVEIDYCPTCRGVWLDRDELAKLLEWSQGRRTSSAPEAVLPVG